MTVIIQTHIACDNCGKRYGTDNKHFTADTHRKGAKKEGWINEGGSDFCGKQCKEEFKSYTK